MGVIKRVVKPKTHKGKKIILARQPKLIEDPKQTLFLKGRKASQYVQNLMKDLYNMKSPGCILLNKKHDIVPMENAVNLENLVNKHDCTLFFFASHTKKRPNNLIIGRNFDDHVLDMFEFEVSNYKSLAEFRNEKITKGIKPCLVFSGPAWEDSSVLSRIKSVLIDCFHREKIENVALQGLEHVINFIVTPDNKILFRSYKISLKKSGTRTPRVELDEIGPSFDLTMRRTMEASEDLFKRSLKQPKELKTKTKKNISRDKLGVTRGRVHLGKQNIQKIQTRKMKGLRKTSTKVKKTKSKKKNKKNN